jgi:hypothetical protein
LGNEQLCIKEIISDISYFDDNRLKNKKEISLEIFDQWKHDSSTIKAYFKARDRKGARKPMITQIIGFLHVLFLVNGKQLDETQLHQWKKSIQELEHAPVNAAERLSFIFEQPDHYHSYIQLSELFSEWEKKSVILLGRKT